MKKLLKFLVLPSLTLVLFLGASALRADEPDDGNDDSNQNSLNLSDSTMDNWWGGLGWGSSYCYLYPSLCGLWGDGLWGGYGGYGGWGWGGRGWDGGGWDGGWDGGRGGRWGREGRHGHHHDHHGHHGHHDHGHHGHHGDHHSGKHR